jgi:hypothetical protein
MGTVLCVVIRDTALLHLSMTVIAYLWCLPNVQAKVGRPCARIVQPWMTSKADNQPPVYLPCKCSF